MTMLYGLYNKTALSVSYRIKIISMLHINNLNSYLKKETASKG